jgi:hypothetical protein
MPTPHFMARPEITGRLPLSAFYARRLDNAYEWCRDYCLKHRLARMVTPEVLTSPDDRHLRDAFLTLLGAGEQKQAINHPSQFKKDKEFEQMRMSVFDAQLAMGKALRRWAGGRGGGPLAYGSPAASVMILI